MKALMFVLLLSAGDTAADAALKAQEGSVDQWIEYYARERAKLPEATSKAPVAAETRAESQPKEEIKK